MDERSEAKYKHVFCCLEREIMSSEEGGVMRAIARNIELKTSSEEAGI